MTVASLPGRPYDAVGVILHAEDWEGELCGDGGLPYAIAWSNSVASPSGTNASELTFVVPIDYVNPGPLYTSPGKGWYRLQVRPNIGVRVPVYPQQYVLSVYRDTAGAFAVPEVE
jgi:hypothetical protein